jgi:hypothetical protein
MGIMIVDQGSGVERLVDITNVVDYQSEGK